NMESVFEEKDFTWLNYSKNFDILKVLKTFSSIEDQKEVDIRPNVKEVLFENFILCKEEIKKLLNNGGSSSSVDFILDKAFDLPVKYSFHKFNGLVKEVSKNLGKKVRLKLSGIQGSLEKQKLDSLLEAMVHLIRNSLDHGIEKPEHRLSLGKDEVGEIEVSCHKGQKSELVIIIRDDGQGIDTNKIVEKTRVSGLVAESEIVKMSEEEKLQLIFLTSLSTKEIVSEISGRGVGMDVVQRVLNDAGATIEIKNSFGIGLQFTITFPYSLAV
ncbi:ATP-binding protein, partial [Bacteriovoracales bacterium]|nr:ATP-binding protein [Bacteriovoracales bacterium]